MWERSDPTIGRVTSPAEFRASDVYACLPRNDELSDYGLGVGLTHSVDTFRGADTVSKMEAQGRRAKCQFTDKVLAGAVRLVLEEGKRVTEAARCLFGFYR